ncbi:unnamed protein product, partial [marine sediment metagenome]
MIAPESDQVLPSHTQTWLLPMAAQLAPDEGRIQA